MVNKYWQIYQLNSLWIPAKGLFIELIESICQFRRSNIVSQLNNSGCVYIICDSAWLNCNKKVIFNEECIIGAQLCINRHFNFASNCNWILTNERKIKVQWHREVSLCHILGHKGR